MVVFCLRDPSTIWDLPEEDEGLVDEGKVAEKVLPEMAFVSDK